MCGAGLTPPESMRALEDTWQHQMPPRNIFADSEKAEFLFSTPSQQLRNGDGKSCILQGLSWEIKILHGYHPPSWETARQDLSCTHSKDNLQANQLLLRELQRCSYTGEGPWGTHYQVIFNWPNPWPPLAKHKLLKTNSSFEHSNILNKVIYAGLKLL